MSRVTFLLKGNINTGSSRIRVIQFLNYLRKNGLVFKVFERSTIVQKQSSMCFWISFLLSCLISKCVFIQKPVLSPIIFNLIKLFRVKIIIDIDDAIWVNSKGQDLMSLETSSFGQNLNKVFKKSDVLICGSNYLKNEIDSKIFNLHSLVIRPSIVIPPLKPKIKDTKIRIGWIGNSINLVEMEPLLPILETLKSNHRVEIIICSDKLNSIFYDLVNHISWSIQSEREFLEICDIGLMPIRNDLRSYGRCGYKAIQFMAYGIPVVSSDCGVSKELIINNFNGILCKSDSDWLDGLTELIHDLDKRERIGNAGKSFVKENCNSELTQKKLFNIIKTQMI